MRRIAVAVIKFCVEEKKNRSSVQLDQLYLTKQLDSHAFIYQTQTKGIDTPYFVLGATGCIGKCLTA